MKKEADDSILVGGRFHKQRNLCTRLVLGGCRVDRILKVYTEALTGFSHVVTPDGLNSTLLSQGCVLELALTVGTVSRMSLPRTGNR